MKKIFLPILSGAILLLPGCVDDNSMFSEPKSIRSYETDSQIMAQFVEIDMKSGEYVINPEKKNYGNRSCRQPQQGGIDEGMSDQPRSFP